MRGREAVVAEEAVAEQEAGWLAAVAVDFRAAAWLAVPVPR